MGEGARGARARERRGRAGARRHHPRLRARLRREGRRLPPHPLEPGRRADHRGDPRARLDDAGLIARRHRLHQRPRHRHARERQDGVAWAAWPCSASACKRVPISSNKSMIGHTLTAAGAVEAVLSLLTIRERPHPADDQLHTCRTRPSRSTWCRTKPAMRRCRTCCRTRSASAARTPASSSARSRRRRPGRAGLLAPSQPPGQRCRDASSSPAAAKGVGAAIVRALVEAGHDVDFTYRSSGDAADALVDELQAAHPGRKRSRRMRSIWPIRARSTSSARRSRARPSSASSTTPASPTTRLPP